MVAVQLLLALTAYAQKTKTVEGEYNYIQPGNVTLDEARAIALERARTKALADEFGTIVSRIDETVMENDNRESNTSFYSLGNSEVKGEWIETIEEKTEEQIIDGQHVVIAKVKGKAREIAFAKVNFETRLLRNGKNDGNESEQFADGDDFYISFRSPAQGYLAVFLLDKEREATCIIPEPDKELCPVERNKRYVFIDNESGNLILTCDHKQELNQLYIIFSPNKFRTDLLEEKGNNDDLQGYGDNVRHLPYQGYMKFQKWLGTLRKNDPEVQVVTKFIKIKKAE